MWTPLPKPTCPLVRRVMMYSSGRSQRRGSRLAAPRDMSTFSPSPTGTPPISTGRVVVRKKVCTGLSKRTASSNAARAREGSSRSIWNCSGKRAKQYSAAPMPFTVVSSPAVSNERTSSGASSCVISPASAAACTRAPKPPGAKFSRRHCSMTHATCGAASASAVRRNALSGPKALKARPA